MQSLNLNHLRQVCSKSRSLFVHLVEHALCIGVLPEVLHTVFVTDPFKARLLIIIAHPMLHCRFVKVYVVLDFCMSNLPHNLPQVGIQS